MRIAKAPRTSVTVHPLAIALLVVGCGKPADPAGDTANATDAPADSGASSDPTSGAACPPSGAGCDPQACASEESAIAVVVLEGDVCTCPGSEQVCLSWSDVAGTGGSAAPGCYFDVQTGEVAAHPVIWMDVPDGWAHCGDPGSPAACGCCGDAMGCVAGPPMLCGAEDIAQSCADWCGVLSICEELDGVAAAECEQQCAAGVQLDVDGCCDAYAQLVSCALERGSEDCDFPGDGVPADCSAAQAAFPTACNAACDGHAAPCLP